MARWLISRMPDRVEVFYFNLLNGLRYDCGTVSAAVDDYEILSWIMDTGVPAHGDHICLSDGTSFHYNQPRPATACN